VLATQNPLEQEGTYPLPEAQLDRFMFSVIVSYPSHAEENRIIAETTRPRKIELDRLLTAEQVTQMQRVVRDMTAPPGVVRYAVALARATRPADSTAPRYIQRFVDCGAGPRAGQYLVLAAKARAVMLGRETPTVEDVRAAATPVLRHRMFTNFTALSENVKPDDLIDRLLADARGEPDASPIVYDIPDTTREAGVEVREDADPVELIREMRPVTQRIRDEVRQVIVGQTGTVDLVLTALFAAGHCLLIGVPGLAKTMLVQTLADVLELDFKRVQFTPDLMPSDITGTDVMETNEKTGERHFRFIPGPVFTNLLLADEINRTPPKTQAALLEAMQELSVTAGNTTYDLSPPFFVLATQNPLEQEGTYPLPEAQLDRFMFNIHLDYPAAGEEPIIVDRTTAKAGREPGKVIGAADILRIQRIVRRVPLSRHVLTYVTTLVRATRPETPGAPKNVSKYVHCGAGPRAAQYLVLGAKARAVMLGRPNVSVSDVRAVAPAVLQHRIFTNFLADAEEVTPLDLIEQLLQAVPEPKVSEQLQLEADAAEQEAALHTSDVVNPALAMFGGAAEPTTDEPTEKGPAPQPPTRTIPENRTPKPVDGEDVIKVACPRCGQIAALPESARGRQAKCWDCDAVFGVDEAVF